MKKVIFALAILFSFYISIYPQCSDAGVCSIGDHISAAAKNEIFFSLGYGYSGKDDDVTYKSVNAEGKIFVDNNSFFVAKIPFGFQSGPRGSESGMGDLTVLFNYGIWEETNFSIMLSAGLKLATSRINGKNYLPQTYQSGLGTNDFLFGATATFDQFSFALGYQLAGKEIPESINKLERGDDILLKGGYNFDVDGTNISSELFYIKRLTKSAILLSGETGSPYKYEVPKSDQSQLNLLINVNRDLGNDFSFAGTFALPFLKRDVNVDGLTRKFTLNVGIVYRF